MIADLFARLILWLQGRHLRAEARRALKAKAYRGRL